MVGEPGRSLDEGVLRALLPRVLAGLREIDRLGGVLGERHRWHAVRAYLHELDGDLPAAATTYAQAARRATDVAERDHLVRQAARTRAQGGEVYRSGSGWPGPIVDV